MRLIPRQQMIVDPKLQGRLIVRVAAYWFFSLVAVGIMLLAWEIAQGPFGPYFNTARFNTLWYAYVSVALASLLFLPVLLADTILISNRFAGPICRVRKQMRALADGQTVERIRFRKKDDWAGLQDDFNALVDYVEQLKSRASVASAATAEKRGGSREPMAAAACPGEGKRPGDAPPLVDITCGHAYAEWLQNVP